MQYFKELNLPFTYQAALERAVLDQVNFHELTCARFLVLDKTRLLRACPLLGVTLLRCKVLSQLQNASLIVLLPNSDIEPHKDLDVEQHIALNFPIFGCAGSSTVFYKTHGLPERLSVHVNVLDDPFDGVQKAKATQGYVKYKRAEVTEVARLELLTPYWLNVAAVHNVQNFKDTMRVSLSLRFNGAVAV